FVHAGYGYAKLNGKRSTVQPDYQAKSLSTNTYIMGFGWNTWFTPRFGINVQTMAKFVSNPLASPHIQHSFSLIYKIGEEKKSKKRNFQKKRY
ncbi:MAG: hypothetical protein H0X62_11740, partial [Bacteroidetes bacterium]|nr:hypothetical protein [Bacteroidota bacterium]